MTVARPHTLILIPTYNNAGTVSDVVGRALAQSLPVLVVNDGSTDATAELLARMQQDNDALQVLSFPVNRGKGRALQAGLLAAKEQGYVDVITLDADGQHFPEDIPQLLAQAGANRLVAGSRNLTADGMPRGNTFANRFSNFWFRLQTGRAVSDTQCGFRVYPVQELSGLRRMTSRYEAELLLLVFAAWKGLDIVSVPIRVVYPEDRVSHFRPYRDFLRISLLNTCLCLLALVYGYPRRLFTALFHRRKAV